MSHEIKLTITDEASLRSVETRLELATSQLTEIRRRASLDGKVTLGSIGNIGDHLRAALNSIERIEAIYDK